MFSRLRYARRALPALALWAFAWSGCRGESQRSFDAELAQGPSTRSAPKKVVVLGSSTSAGVGPRDPNDAYVPRYAAYLARQFPDFTLLNLAVSGQTTYHIQPTGFRPPAQRAAPVAGKNISAALALKPQAILINLPSNDAAANIPAHEQLENFARVARLSADAHVALWITTTQPRNFGNADQVALQRSVREAILAIYAPRVLDFWAPFASSAGGIEPKYDAGDGIHLNAAAHTVLLKTLIAAQLPEALLREP